MSNQKHSRGKKGPKKVPTPDWKAIATKSKHEGAVGGFAGFKAGKVLCDNHSNSKSRSEVEIDLAARQLEHCLEAWNFLSQAAWALLNAQTNQAIHMAYYTEVRAADSLLASTGIAVKSMPSYYLSQGDVRYDIKGRQAGTHSLIRNIWPYWCKRPDAESIFNDLRVVQSVSLKDVGDTLGLGAGRQNKLLSWGYELVNLSKDHQSRNTASYEVLSSYNGIESLQSRDYRELLAKVWQHMAPAGNEGQFRFEVLYAQYLIWSYCHDFATQPNVQDYEAEYLVKFDSIINRMSTNTGVPEPTLRMALDSGSEKDPLFEIFELASDQKAEAENVFVRAFILARLATSKLNTNLSVSGCHNGLDWIRAWLYEIGVLNDGDAPEDVALNSEQLIENAISVADVSLRRVWSDVSAEAATTCRLNSGICWGLGF
ncbi:hypothetical protein [Marinobacter sp. DUT-1]|uniref:hypothetical protein n=1 Tax=Marinobacter sp. DUT-1 TaxID=3412037 RepID=UPI003D1668EC